MSGEKSLKLLELAEGERVDDFAIHTSRAGPLMLAHAVTG